jgi:hypothetical protein
MDTNAADLGTISKSTSRTDLDTAVAGLTQYAAQQELADATATSQTKAKNAAREDLRLNHMQPIAMIARKKLGDTPNIQDLALPRKSTSDEALVAKGFAMVKSKPAASRRRASVSRPGFVSPASIRPTTDCAVFACSASSRCESPECLRASRTREPADFVSPMS